MTAPLTRIALTVPLIVASTFAAANGPPADEIYRPAATPPDARVVDPARMTRLDPPPLPGEVLLPLPPAHRIAKDDETVAMDEALRTLALGAIDRGLDALKRTQRDDGSWMPRVRAAPTDEPDRPAPVSVAATALALKAFVQRGPREEDAEAIDRALALIQRARRDDGSFEGGPLANYVTASVVSAIASLDDAGRRLDLGASVAALKRMQWDQEQGINPEQDWFGGAGYGNQGRPDLSNTQMMLDALYDAGLSPDEPAMQRALAFISRTQNLRATNPAKWAGNDGGFVYTPANGGESMASELAGEGRRGELLPEGVQPSLRSYGSMSYAGFKSMLYAGLSPNDVRVRAVFDWVRRNWTMEENPGMGQMGLYYYYHTMARALRVAQQHIITDVDGTRHNWREALSTAILERQHEDGTWTNTADRWLEGESDLATAYALLALQEALKPVMLIPEQEEELSR